MYKMTERYQQPPFLSNSQANENACPNIHLIEADSAGRINRVNHNLWRKLHVDEWTFTLLLFLFSSSIVLGKLFFNYDFFSFLDINIGRLTVPVFNNSHPYYKDITEKNVIESLNRYNWLIKAILYGLVTTGIIWFIIYKDSNVPGINPPSPFSPSKKRIFEAPSMQINYIVGMLIGFLVFLYMCL